MADIRGEEKIELINATNALVREKNEELEKAKRGEKGFEKRTGAVGRGGAGESGEIAMNRREEVRGYGSTDKTDNEYKS